MKRAFCFRLRLGLVMGAQAAPLGLARRRWSARLAPPSGPPVKCVGNPGEGLGQGEQVPVIHPPGIQGGGEHGQCRWPAAPLGTFATGTSRTTVTTRSTSTTLSTTWTAA